MTKIKLLELFAGTRSIGKVAEKKGIEVFSIDIEPFPNINLVRDIDVVNMDDIPFVPNVIWASPPCTTYSVAAFGTYRDGIRPIHPLSITSDNLVKKTIKILSWYPNAMYWIENPMGMLRKMPFMTRLERTTLTYCSYGYYSMKPTDIWTNQLYTPLFNPMGWRPKPMCFNGNNKCHHEASPRSKTVREYRRLGFEFSKGGVSREMPALERSIIPVRLCVEVINYVLQKFNHHEN